VPPHAARLRLARTAQPGPVASLRRDRDGISIGEAAGLVLLERPDAAADGPLLLGAGASSDGHHMSSPHPEGLGAVGAMRAALDAARLAPGEIDYVNLHGTGTAPTTRWRTAPCTTSSAPECRAARRRAGPAMRSAPPARSRRCFAAICLEDGLVPGCLGIDAADPEFRSDVATANRRTAVRRVLSNSFGSAAAIAPW
jgi:3-oxoacyl-[acyl-carrier-protein] synthase-1